MTEVVAPPPATERACPHCGVWLAPDQEWCLNCGTAVATRIAPTPRWRFPIVLVGGLLTLIVAALLLALIELSGDPQPVAKAPAAATATPAGAPADDGGGAAPVAGATPAPAPVPAVTPSVTPAPTTSLPGTPSGTVAAWPSGTTGWTAVLASTPSRAEAERKARAATAAGGAGVLHSDDFSSLRKGYWVVFSGRFDTQKAAESAAQSAGSGAYARRIVPR